jgi:SAM-dependent methyltransferase
MTVLSRTWQWFEQPHRLLAVREALAAPGSYVLDVGCGNHSPSMTKKYFKNCVYHGVDNSDWNRDAQDMAVIDRFYDLDLEKPETLAAIEDCRYDAIVCSHVLEHVTNPQDVVDALLHKLKPGALLYIEVPSERSLTLPRAKEGWFGIKGCLNFFDDETHRTMVELDQIAGHIREQGFEASGARYRWLWRRVVLLPLYAAAGLALRGYVPASVVWDASGFAKYIVVRRPDKRS